MEKILFTTSGAGLGTDVYERETVHLESPDPPVERCESVITIS